MAISDYSTTPGNNSTISGIDIAENCAPAGLNNAVRQLMADIASAIGPLTASAAELNTLDGITASTSELNILDGVTATADEINKATTFGLIAQGSLSGSELIIAIPSDFEGIEFSYWGYLPSTSGQALRLAIGSGTIGSPVWGSNHLEQVQTVINTTYTPGSTAAAGFVFASFDQITGQPPGSGRVVANGFNVSGFVWGDTVRRGVVSGPLRATSHGSFAEETTVVHTLIRIFVSSGTMSGTYRLTGYRKP